MQVDKIAHISYKLEKTKVLMETDSNNVPLPANVSIEVGVQPLVEEVQQIRVSADARMSVARDEAS